MRQMSEHISTLIRKKNYRTLHNESTGPKIESSLNHEYSSVLNTMFFVGGFFVIVVLFFIFWKYKINKDN